jgi:uncharacterized RDD family membrane protein YckC
LDSHPPQLDSHIEVVTPENIEFEYRVASPFERVTAYLIDMLIIILLVGAGMLVGLFFAFVSGNFWMLLATGMIVAFVMMWFYAGVFETFWNGQTPGKRAMGLRVLQIDGRPITAGQAILRNFLRVVDGQPMYGNVVGTYVLGIIATSTNRRYQRLGDLACGTMVVSEERTKVARFNQISDVDTRPIHNLLPANALPNRSQAKVISRYVDRRKYFGPARRAEIARHLGELLVEQYNLPPNTDHDILLCALYQRAFLTARSEPADERPRLPVPPPPLAEVAAVHAHPLSPMATPGSAP